MIEGVLEQDEGYVRLPLRGDLYDRPRQIVCFERGKPAETKWGSDWTETKTPQRFICTRKRAAHTNCIVHCSHEEGLNMPILGDSKHMATRRPTAPTQKAAAPPCHQSGWNSSSTPNSKR